MMGVVGSCMFKAGYKVYADTCIGRIIHERLLNRIRTVYGENAMHTQIANFKYGDIIVQPIPVLTSNYIYVVGDLVNGNFVLIDVGDPTMFIKMGYQPAAILTTHKHWDHSYGNNIMRSAFKDIPVYGGQLDHVPGATIKLQDGETVRVERLEFTAIWTPGHTRGHMCYFLDGSKLDAPSMLFTGDHLMTAGCGAVFECSVKTMVESLEKIKSFSDSTLIWPGHEAGLTNLLMAAFLEDDQENILQKLVWAFYQRMLRMGTCPSTLGEEKKFNPFLRTNDVSLIERLGLGDMLEKSNAEDVAVAAFKEIINKVTDDSEASLAKKREILSLASSRCRMLNNLEICSNASIPACQDSIS